MNSCGGNIHIHTYKGRFNNVWLLVLNLGYRLSTEIVHTSTVKKFFKLVI